MFGMFQLSSGLPGEIQGLGCVSVGGRLGCVSVWGGLGCVCGGIRGEVLDNTNTQHVHMVRDHNAVGVPFCAVKINTLTG